MSEPADLRAAVAAGAMGAQRTYDALLNSIVSVARNIFEAKASSILLHDEDAAELVFAAVAGEGSQTLIGDRVPDRTGIAGWVLTARQPIVLEDVASDPRFARDVAQSTGYVPSGLMACPLMFEDRALGVLSVLDRPQRPSFSLSEMDLLGQFAHQAALALDLAARAQAARAILSGAETRLADLAVLAERLERLDEDRRPAADALVASLARLLR
ncbi:MAG TPA: GAF domain-containing protein [Solirubrobacteraceae bacterium]|nr:GAF domain-containing protein [Solirubrobacteraceae bacterium]